MAMPKNQQQAAYYRTDSQMISKARTILSEEIGDPKQLWNLKKNLNKTKRKPSSNIGEGDRIVVGMKLEHGKSFICHMTILPHYYVEFALMIV